jgi:kynurenine 3-monooxygenase
LGHLITIKTSPWNYADKLLLLGDAAHAIVPFYGQGMNAGFEDCLLLDEFLQKDADWAKVFADFSQQRKKDTDAIAELALLNYEEMRSKTADPSFVLQKRIEAELANRFPEIWKSVYAQVSFQDVPYSEALNNFTLQENLMQKVMQIENIENFFTSETFANRVIDEIFDWIGKKK